MEAEDSPMAPMGSLPLSRGPSHDSAASSCPEYAWLGDGDDDVKAGDATVGSPVVSYQYASGAKQPLPAFAPGESTLSFPSSFLVHRLEDVVIGVAELLALSRDEALLLLVHYKWSSAAAQEAFLSDPAGVRGRIGMRGAPPPAAVGGSGSGSSGGSGGAAPTTPAMVFDPTLLEDVPAAECDAAACGHLFSHRTWVAHLSAALDTPLTALGTLCPHALNGCTEVVRPRMWRDHLGAGSGGVGGSGAGGGGAAGGSGARAPLWPRYVREMVRSFTAGTAARHLAVCPGGGCDLVVQPRPPADGGGVGAATVACANGHTFCFACLHSPHAPASCALTRAWDAREMDEGESLLWITAHTKRCPQCREPIEKNQVRGCGEGLTGLLLSRTLAPEEAPLPVP